MSARKSPKTQSAPPAAAKKAEHVQARPYPGLRFYSDQEKLLFAGRDDEVKECAKKLVLARVLVLHGRTGCGKSSFLRAGVKPYLERTGSSICFADAPGGFNVIRSSVDPLKRIGETLLEVADALIAGKKSKFGSRASDVTAADVREDFPDDEAFRESLKRDAEKAFAAIVALAAAMVTPPIFVIDQAEEVFTLRSKDPAELDAQQRSAREYFKFIHMMASQDTRSRVVISLRTEYKGLFDDHVSVISHPGNRLIGFYLKDLDLDGLKAAILRPTVTAKDAEWKRMKLFLDLDEDVVAPGDLPGALRISPKAAEVLAKELLKEEKVATGGILPTLQAACTRLWQQSRDAMNQRGDFQVTENDLKRLGDVATQIEEYIQEALRTVCAGKKDWSANLSAIVTIWMRAMAETLVKVEADGRAVTRSIPQTDLIASVLSRLDDVLKDDAFARSAIAQLAGASIGLLNRDGDMITLGHDSVALALNKWTLSAPSERGRMMMRMGMSTMPKLQRLTMDDLFLKEERPNLTQIVAPADFQWDRRLPHFAQDRGFCQRLGITIAQPPELDAVGAVNADDVTIRDWPALREALVAREQSWKEDRRRHNKDNERVLVAAEYASFPGEYRENEYGEDARRDFAWRWSDLLVSNLFVGSALIGPDAKFAAAIEEATKKPELNWRDHSFDKKDSPEIIARKLDIADEAAESLRVVVRDALRETVEAGATIWCTNDDGGRMLAVAARLCGDDDLAEKIKSAATIKSLRNEEYAVRDPLVDKLLEGKGLVIGGAGTRAFARQCGFHSYFGAKELAIIAYAEMKRRQHVDYLVKSAGAKSISPARLAAEKKRRGKLTDLAAEVQQVVSHTVWHVGLPATAWDQGLNRAFMLRLAAVGYFTAEYVRTNMDDFIGFTNNWVNQSYVGDKDGMSGQTIMRFAVKDTIADCYMFLPFDAFGSSVFDLDSLYAYWSDHSNLQTRSIAGEIYAELNRLREMTLAHYQICAEAIGWMRYGGAYDPSHKDISTAFRLKELAWNNYNIYNFYDSERYMSRAAEHLRRCMEVDFEAEDIDKHNRAAAKEQ